MSVTAFHSVPVRNDAPNSLMLGQASCTTSYTSMIMSAARTTAARPVMPRSARSPQRRRLFPASGMVCRGVCVAMMLRLPAGAPEWNAGRLEGRSAGDRGDDLLVVRDDRARQAGEPEVGP